MKESWSTMVRLAPLARAEEDNSDHQSAQVTLASDLFGISGS